MGEYIGKKFKEIRRNKGFTQRFMSQSVLTQSAYSKFELDKNEISFISYLKLLEKLEMDHEEFYFISKGYKYSERENLLIEFFNLTYNDPNQLRIIINNSQKILKEEDNALINDIMVICNALIILTETNNMELARTHVESVWNRLAERNYWYLSEIKILNTILFLFPANIAKEMTKKALENLVKYSNFRDANKLAGNLKLNLSLLLIEEKEFIEALSLIEEVITISKKFSMYKQLAAAHVRKGICFSWIKENEGEKEIEKGILMLELLEDNALREILKGEARRYSKFQY